MKRSKDPFEAETIEEEEEEEESPPQSPVSGGEGGDGNDDDVGVLRQTPNKRKTSENMDVDVTNAREKKMAKMQSILSQFTEQQMSRYEAFRRSTFHKEHMRKLLGNIMGCKKIAEKEDPRLSIVSGIAKMFVGELVETARLVMVKRNETGHIRPCHIRESYRWLKLQGKVPQRSVPRLFR